jgi:signal transduction histidine kinase
MGYNTTMHEKTDVVKLLRIAAILWLAYLGVSALIDYTLKSPGPVERYFYIADSIISLFFLAISFWSWIQKVLGRTFLPLMIGLICVLPITANQIAIRFLFSGALPPPEATLTRVIPFLIIALLLIAWQYKWQHILIFSFAVAILNIGLLFISASDTNKGAFSSGLFAIITQVFSFLMFGFFISTIVGWLRNRSRSLEEANAKLKNYSQTLEDLAVSKERTRIAQELHDTLSHTLSGLSVQLETMKAYWDVDPVTARKRLDKSLTATRSGLEETRRILMALRAKPLEELGLVPAIREMAEEVAVRGGIALELDLPENLNTISPGVEQCLFRVAQEGITNVLQHAKATNLSIKLESQGEKVSLIMQDNGVGFDVNMRGGNNHLGLLGMRERAELINGELVITSQPGQGTIIKLTI